MSDSKRLLIYTGGGRTEGLGHIFRSLRLARVMERLGWKVFLAMKKEEFLPKALMKGVSLIPFCGEMKGVLPGVKPEMVVCDLPPGRERGKIFPLLQERRIFFCAIDDMGLARDEADLLVSPSLVPPFQKKEKFHWGEKYAVLGEEFRGGCRRRYIRKRIKSILVSLGGSDPGDLSLKVLKALEGRQEKVVLVQGPQGAKELPPLAIPSLKRIVAADAMRELMDEADLAFIAGGVTLYEAASRRLPSIVLAQEKYQGVVADVFQDKGAACYLGMGKNISIHSIKKAFFRILEDRDLRQSLSRSAGALVDGKGAERLGSLLQKNYDAYQKVASQK